MEKFRVFDRVSTSAILILAAYALTLAVSVTDGRVRDLQDKQYRLQQYDQEIASLTAMIPSARDPVALSNRLVHLQGLSNSYRFKIDVADGTIGSGSQQALAKIREYYFCNPATYFHSLSSQTNILVIGLLSCAIAYALGRMVTNSVVTLVDLGLSAVPGILAVLVIKGTRALVAYPASGATGIDVTNPYGIALFSALAGLTMNQFCEFINPIAGRIWRAGNAANKEN